MSITVESIAAYEEEPVSDVPGSRTPSPTRRIDEVWQRTRRQLVRPGDVLSVKRLGLARFRYSVILPDGRVYIEVVSPEYGFHAVWPDRVKSVSRRTLRPAKAA